MDTIAHVPTDDEVGLGPQNSERRALFLSACALCKQDYEVRDGLWLDTFTRKGTKIGIMVCKACHAGETDGVTSVVSIK